MASIYRRNDECFSNGTIGDDGVIGTADSEEVVGGDIGKGTGGEFKVGATKANRE